MTEGKFKQRFYNQKTSFKDTEKRHVTKLASHIWDLKDKGANFKIKWDILEKSKPYMTGRKICDRCTAEKRHISGSLNSPSTYLNSRSEVFGKCRHLKKYVLRSWAKPPD